MYSAASLERVAENVSRNHKSLNYGEKSAMGQFPVYKQRKLWHTGVLW